MCHLAASYTDVYTPPPWYIVAVSIYICLSAHFLYPPLSQVSHWPRAEGQVHEPCTHKLMKSFRDIVKLPAPARTPEMKYSTHTWPLNALWYSSLWGGIKVANSWIPPTLKRNNRRFNISSSANLPPTCCLFNPPVRLSASHVLYSCSLRLKS